MGTEITDSRFGRMRARLDFLSVGMTILMLLVAATILVSSISGSTKILGVGSVLTFGAVFAISRGESDQTDVAWAMNFLIMVGSICIALAATAILAPTNQTFFVKLAALLFLSFLPGWLYLQFVSIKGKTLWDEYVLSLHRMKAASDAYLPPAPRGSNYSQKRGREHPHEIERSNLFVQKFEGAYGEIMIHKQGGGGRTRYRSDTFRPVLLLTLILAISWALVLQPDSYQNLDLLPGLDPSERPPLAGDALRFGFLGGYFFIIQMLMRRYFQNDLKASAYISSIVRIISVILIVQVLHFLLPEDVGDWENTLAFFVGMFPQTGLQAARVRLNKTFSNLIPSLESNYPLSDLDGLDVWYEARLVEEGIEDMQNLATANLVDIMLHTRVPLERLIDWIDQAHLYLRVGKRDEPQDRDRLRLFGIRTATDLQDAFARPLRDAYTTDEEYSEALQHNRDLISKLRNVLKTEDEDTPSRSEVILKTLEGEPNLFHVRSWKGAVGGTFPIDIREDPRLQVTT